MAGRGRKNIELDVHEFEEAVKTLENKGVFASRSELWAALEATEWAKTRVPRPLTRQVALLYAEKQGILIQTPKGRRGKLPGSGPMVPAGGRKKKNFSVEILAANIPPEERTKLFNTIERAKTGSLKARVKLMCLDCTNWCKNEVALCEITGCPLHDVRPYKRTALIVLEDAAKMAAD